MMRAHLTEGLARIGRAALGRGILIPVVSSIIGFSIPLLVLTTAHASATPCGLNCGRLYAGQTTQTSSYSGIRGYIAWPSTSLTSPTNDGILHWIGLTQTVGTAEWLQFGAWNGWGNGGSGSSAYNYYGEFSSWCNGYSYSTYGSTSSSAGRLNVVEYTGESYDCGSGGQVTVYKVEG